MTDEPGEQGRPIALQSGLRVLCFARLGSPSASHFLCGVAEELCDLGHDARLIAADTRPEEVCGEADLVIVHDSLTPQQVSRIARHRRRHGGYRLLFRHGALQGLDPRVFDLTGYDGVLAASRVIADICLAAGMTPRGWIWPDAADCRRFCRRDGAVVGDVVFIGAWGDQSHGVELRHFLLEPVKLLGLRGRAYGPPYPAAAVALMGEAGIEFAGWAPPDRIPAIFAGFLCTVHVPSRARSRLLPGLPSIRLFEAMACGAPLVSAPWLDCDGMFTVGRDFLLARDGAEMRRHLKALVADPELRAEISGHARRTIESRHSCAERANQLLQICGELDLRPLPLPATDPLLASLRPIDGRETAP